jgi:cytochrome P450
MMDLIGLPDTDDSSCLELFDTVERLANLAKRSWATTTMPPRVAAQGSQLAQQISQKVPDVFNAADPDTTIGRCRELGMGVRETRALTTLMVVAGTATLASTLGRMIAILHDSGAQHQLLADRQLIPVAVRESLRVTSSMPIVGRGVVKDRTLAGRHLRAGDRVKILTWSINNQLGGFDLDLTSASELKQLWFGGGHHLCIGISLTNVQLAAVLKALTQPNRPWHIKERHYRRNVFVPLYDRLSIQLS